MEDQERECVIMLAATGDGPLCRVGRIHSLKIVGAKEEDELALVHHSRPDLDPVILPGEGEHEFVLDSGIVQVTRIKGINPISVYARTR